MSEAMSFDEIYGQGAELLPARTLLSLYSGGSGHDGGAGDDGSDGGHGADGHGAEGRDASATVERNGSSLNEAFHA